MRCTSFLQEIRLLAITPFNTVWLVAALASMLTIGACQSPPRTIKAEVQVPSYSDIARYHNQRVERLSRVYSRGVIELRWRDDDGRHFEQGSIDLWLQLPRHTALRVEKLGNVFLWLGSDAEHFWLFDMLSDDTVLHVSPHTSPLEDAGVFSVRPLALLDLIGLSKLPLEDDDDDAEQLVVSHDQQRNAWVITAPGQGGMMRLYFARESYLPIRVESLNDNGEVAFTSVIRPERYRSVPRPGAPASQFASMATLVDITATNTPDGIRDGEIKLALDSPTSFVDNQPMDRVFDLPRLIQAMRPTYFSGDLPNTSD